MLALEDIVETGVIIGKLLSELPDGVFHRFGFTKLQSHPIKCSTCCQGIVTEFFVLTKVGWNAILLLIRPAV